MNEWNGIGGNLELQKCRECSTGWHSVCVWCVVYFNYRIKETAKNGSAARVRHAAQVVGRRGKAIVDLRVDFCFFWWPFV